MENEAINLGDLICDSLNTIFFKIFSSIDHTIYSNLDNILFIRSDMINDLKFQQLFGTDSTNGLLLIANSLIFGIILFYILRFATSHLIYSKIDSPYQFAFKCIIFVACANSSFWICEQIVTLADLISSSICEVGYFINGTEISFSNLINTINSTLYPSLETFDIFSFDGILKLGSSLGILYILFVYAVRFILCKILILLSPFAVISLIHHQFDGFFKGWLQQFLTLLSMQIFVAIVLSLGFCLEFYSGNILSQLIYFGIIVILTKCHSHTKKTFTHMFSYSHNTLKKFI